MALLCTCFRQPCVSGGHRSALPVVAVVPGLMPGQGDNSAVHNITSCCADDECASVQERVIGQADAVSAVSRAMKRARTGLKDPRRPIAAMLFAGPTGVGKTELTKACGSMAFCSIW